MRNFKFIVIVLFSLVNLSSFSQGEFVVEIDRTTGHITKTGPPVQPGIIYVYPNWRVINENSGIFIFPIASPTALLLSVNISNDSVINEPLYNIMLGELEYSNSLNTLYGLLHDNANNIKHFVSIDPITSIPTIIGDTIPSSAMFQGKSAYNQVNNIYYFINSPDTLYSIDATNGNVISKPVLSILPSIQMICEIAFNDSTNTLYGLLFDNYNYSLCSINTTTGNVTTIGANSNLLTCGSATIDEANNQFICIYFLSNNYHITTFDLTTGNIVYNYTVNPLPDALDNVFSLKYNNTTGKLYSIHWDNNFYDTEGFEELTKGQFSFFPNPTTDNLTIETTAKAIIEILNIQGQIIKTINTAEKQTTIDVADLSSGVYIIKAKTERGVAVKKFIKE